MGCFYIASFFAGRKATEQRSCGQRRVSSCPETADMLDPRLRCLFNGVWLTVMLTAVLSTDAGLPGVLEAPRQRPANRDSRCLDLPLPLLPAIFSLLSSLRVYSISLCLSSYCLYYYHYQPQRILDNRSRDLQLFLFFDLKRQFERQPKGR